VCHAGFQGCDARSGSAKYISFCLTGPEGRWLIGAKDPETGKKAIRHLMPPTLCYQIWKTNEN
jgi:hypothetical protein